MIEFDVDMGYLLECDELDKVVLNDEDGEHEPMEFILKDAATMGERNPDGLPIGLTVSNDGNLLNWVGENYVRQDAATVGSGNLTAEQVREAIMSADRWRKPMGDTGMTNTHLIIRDDGWQAIADELNETVGAGTCHIEVHDNLAETEGMGDVWLECDECHWQMPLEPTTPRFKYCPNCRREVVSE